MKLKNRKHIVEINPLGCEFLVVFDDKLNDAKINNSPECCIKIAALLEKGFYIIDEDE